MILKVITNMQLQINYRLRTKDRINICMQLIPANCYPNATYHPMYQAFTTLPSENSIAPEIWTDILGAFSQEQSKQSLRHRLKKQTKHSWVDWAVTTVTESNIPITTSTSLDHILSVLLLISQRYLPW